MNSKSKSYVITNMILLQKLSQAYYNANQNFENY